VNTVFETWSGYLNEIGAEDTHSSHSWICRVQENGKLKIKLLSQGEYNSSKNSSINKLSFSEIFSTSSGLINEKLNSLSTSSFTRPPYPLPLISKINLKIQEMGLVDFSLNKADDEFFNQLGEITSQVKHSESICENLLNIYTRSRNKRLKEKGESIFGTVKWYIWSFFYDKGEQISQIKKSVGTSNDCLTMAINTIRDRIFINMEIFEAEAKVDENMRNSILDDGIDEKFKNPIHVKAKWLTKYASDKFREEESLSEHARDTRIRIVAMLNIWTKLFDQQRSLSSHEIVDNS